MNKKLICILISILVLLSLLILVVANNNNGNNNHNNIDLMDADTGLEINNNDNELAFNEIAIENGYNFRVVRTNEDNENAIPEFRYEVFNNNGEIVRSGTGWRIPSFININENVLKISIGVGTGTQMVQFYSAKNDMFSEVFDTPIVITNELIGLLRWSDSDELNLIVRDIFDIEIYYNEFLLENFSSVANPIDALKGIEYLGNDKLEVTYLSGEHFVEKSIIFEL